MCSSSTTPPPPPPRQSSVPSTLFILRHGARLDQFDSEWHLTSPTPYDPPLTSKGVQQSKQTGQAISKHLSSKQTRIILHTSPFLRCIQTSLALASTLNGRAILRVDAWLGEWLTPDYFVDIDPPPPSRQLCSTALARLAGRTEVTVDWTWDSLNLGSGGEYGEEWGTMHERFQRGLTRLLRYYEQYNNEEEETTVILVTHGAGVNSILGALTRRPVLTDIPVSSLSMAVLRPYTPPTKSMEYDLLLQADTTHLISSSTQANSTSSVNSMRSSTDSSQVIEYHPFRTSSPKPHSSSYSSTDSSQTIRPADKRVIEYHPFRSRSTSSSSLPVAPRLKIRTSSAILNTNATSNSPRLWTATTPTADSEGEEDVG